MANQFLDLGAEAIVTAGNTYGTAVSATGALTGVDTIDMMGNMMSALLSTTAVAGSGTAVVKIQESSDNSTWTDLDNAATFTVVSAANALQIISFKPKKRYVVGYATITGTSVTLQLTFIGQRKTTPANQGGWVNETGGV